MRDANSIDPPAPEYDDLCSNCGDYATRELTATLFACSRECERVLMEEQFCASCHAHVAEGELHSRQCVEGCRAEAVE